MLAHCDLIAFVGATDAAAARHFYETVLGLPLTAAEPTALIFDAHGIPLRVSLVAQFTPAPFTVLGWTVPDIVDAIAELSRQGVSFNQYEGLPQNDLGICTFPDGTRVAWFNDPAGNTLSLTEQAR